MRKSRLARIGCRVWSPLCLCLLALILSPGVRVANAQALYGSIVGNVTDPQGAATPGVTVVATNTQTGLKVETTTDTDGSYTIRNLLPGTYDLTATLQGFREHEQKAVPVNAGNPVRINITLALGNVSETVEVTSETTLLKTEKADLST